MTAKETIVRKVARLLGLAATEGVGWTSAALKVARSRTRAVLLEAADVLGLTGVTKLRKEELAKRVVAVLKELRQAGARAQEKVTGVKKSKAPPAKGATAPAAAVKPPKTAAAPERATVAEPAPPAPAKAPKASKAPKGPKAPAAVSAEAGAPASTAAAAPAEDHGPEQDPTSAAKLDLGPAGRTETHVAQIPWGYGQDRVTAAAVDPDRLYAWWEVTDVAIELARQRLGSKGAHADLALRVFDTTGLIFDGTNAHSWFDHRIDRATRQWFFSIGKPTSSAYVELGLVAGDGGFARISRSSRVDFPRKEPVAWAAPEWMTVVAGQAHHHGPAAAPAPAAGGATGSPGAPAPGASAGLPPPPGGPGGGPGPGPGAEPTGLGPLITWVERSGPGFDAAPLWILRQTATGRQLLVGERFEDRVEWREVTGEGWYQLSARAEWHEAATITSWDSGPLEHPVEVLDLVREAWQGRSYGFQLGPVTHVVHGPWEIVIKNLGASVSRSVLARWQIYRSWITEAGHEVQVSPLGAPPGAQAGALSGGSEGRLGASERAWAGGSELRLGGASEAWRLGASELRMRGASELRWVGGSEQVAGGASERRLQRGGAERLGGASEARLGGASEWSQGGASEQRLREGQARLPLGGSEARLGGSEGRLGGERTSPPPAPGAYPSVEEE